MADVMNGAIQYVVSGTLTSADWQNAVLFPGDLAAEQLAALKEL